MTRPAVALLLAFVLAPTADAETKPESFLDRMVRAHGGAEVLRETDALVQRGTTVSTMRGGEGPVTRWWAHPWSFVIDIGREGRPPERRVLDGAQGWRDGKEAVGPLHSSMVLQAARIVLPKLLLEHADRVQDLGRQDVEGVGRVHVLQLDLGHGMAVVAECDPATARIKRSRGVMTAGERRFEFTATYSDYRILGNGLLMAFREEHSAMNAPIGHTQLESVEILAALPEGTLKP